MAYLYLVRPMRLAIITLLATAAYVLATDSDVPTAIESLADSPSRVVLYSLDPGRPNESLPPDALFHAHNVRGHANITDAAEQRALLRALAAGTREAKPDVINACFNPRHGLRVERGSYAAEFLICFECLQVQACGFQPTDFFVTTAAPQKVFDDSLRGHNLPLPAK